MTRILVLVPGARDEAALARQAGEDHGLDPGIRLEHRAVPGAAAPITSAAERALADIANLAAGLTAEAEGFAAIVIDAMEDCGLSALRSVCAIPVVGPGRASLLYALTLGNRFGLVVPEGTATQARDAVRSHGLERHCAAIRETEWRPGDEQAGGLVEAARACMAAGADTICLGATSMHRASGAVAAAIPVPLVDPRPFALKWAESLLSLGLTHSRRAHPAAMVRKDGMLEAMMRVPDGSRLG